MTARGLRPPQPDLFIARDEIELDRAFATARRTALDASSWIELVPAWLRGGERLLESLLEAVPWQQHYRRMFDQRFLEPRLTAQYQSLRNPLHRALLDAASALSDHYGVKYDNLWLNLYRDGRDSTGWHRDRFSCRRPECIVPVLTLGAARRFLLKPRAGGSSIALEPHCGDLVVMGGRCQQHWVHCVPKDDASIGVRISLNFQSSEQARVTPDR
jgi:alkylated DNA repair dioxygenase AlkB